jgi:hypothetical protein
LGGSNLGAGHFCQVAKGRANVKVDSYIERAYYARPLGSKGAFPFTVFSISWGICSPL